jgi:hypothetical protein
MKKNILENLIQSKKKLMVKKLTDNLKWAKQKEMEEKIRLLRHQSPQQSFKNFLVLSDFYCQVFLDGLKDKKNISQKDTLTQLPEILG